MVQLRIETAKSVFRLIRDGALYGGVASLGITPSQIDFVTQEIPWVGVDRPGVVRSLETLIYSSVEVLGLPRFRVPGEYVAALICSVVAPVNIHLACVWLQREASGSSEQLASTPEAGEVDAVHASKLFALCCALYDTRERTAASAAFDRMVEAAVNRARAGQEQGGPKNV